MEQFEIPEFDVRNPALSSSYRDPALLRPNQTVLEAQARVCTGPTQTRPLDEERAFKVFDTILRSGYSYFLSIEYVTVVCNRSRISSLTCSLPIEAKRFKNQKLNSVVELAYFV